MAAESPRVQLMDAAGAFLAVAIWGYWQGHRLHHAWAPLIVGVIGAVSLALGVIVVHGFPAMQMIYGGAMLLVAATIWNIVARNGFLP